MGNNYEENEFDEELKEEAPLSELETTRQEVEQDGANVIQDRMQPLFGLIETAISNSATDIHLDPVGDKYIVRFRINGIIHTRGMLPWEDAKKLLIQLRVRAKLSITKSFVAQEGQCKWLSGDTVKDIRVTIVPVDRFVSAHLRILTPPDIISSIENLGLRKEEIEIIRPHLLSSQGLVIVGGPTGAGKTTTIYCLANTFDLESIIGVSIEDPIEFDIPFLRQLEVDERHGFYMHEGLRAILRMDPDLLLVTEIRDEQSAVTAVKAAAAASFVLSTIHSTDAASAVEAFQLMSVPHNILGSCLRIIIAQNLVRTLCPKCRIARKPSDEDKELFDRWKVTVPDEIFDPAAGGCEDCDRYGFYGRTGIFEVVEIDEEISRAIIKGISQIDLRNKFREKGYGSIFKSGLIKVADGQTSMSELLDVYWPGWGGGGID